MKKYIFIGGILIFFILIVVTIISMLYGVRKIDESLPPEDKFQNSKEDTGLRTISPLSKDTSAENDDASPVAPAGGAAGGGGGGGSSGTTSVTPQVQEIILPEDIATVPCGMYFAEYLSCNGTCEEGECVQEGRSCYCRLV